MRAIRFASAALFGAAALLSVTAPASVADDGGDNTTAYESDSGTLSGGGIDSGAGDSGGSDSGGTDTGVKDAGGIDSGVEESGVKDSGGTDAGVKDSGVVDPGVEDAGGTDAGVKDSGGTDSGVKDSGVVDPGIEDFGGTDTGVKDAGGTDTGVKDAGGTDTGVKDSGGTDSGVKDSAGVDPGGDGRTDSGGHNVTSFGYTVSPTTVSPGGTVTINATKCQMPTVRVTAPVFDDVTLNGGRSAKAKVSPDAKPGAQYDVTFDCKGERGTAKLTISGGGARPTTPTTPTVPRGVEAGNGGSLSNLDAKQLAAGSALVAGALGAGVYTAWRRSGSRG
ncbi:MULTISPECIES: hypothetical protein [unclassified Streptomyces]|uniref:hypothetical protein n=1 Tax=unclassified Streptomyces TaxID=2593676 RepID=UPI0033C8BCB3